MFEVNDFSLEPGAYRAKLVSVEEADGTNYKTGEPEKYRRWTFELVEEGYEGQQIYDNSTMAFGPAAKAREWVEALLGGRKLERGETIGEEELIGRECDLGIEMKETDRGTFPRINSVHPVRKKSRAEERSETKLVKDVKDGRQPVKEADPASEDDFESIPF